MLVSNFANRLDVAMKLKNIRASEIVKRSEILYKNNKINKPLTKPLISHYLKGTYEAKQDNVFALSLILDVDEAWLMGYDTPMKRDIKNYKIDELGNPVVEIPILGIVKAGYDYMAQENWEGSVNLDKKVADTGEFFALKVKGDSMVPVFFEGDTVIIRRQNDCENNEVAVVIVNGDEGTLKKVKKTDEGIILQPFNPAYGPIMYTNKEIKETPIIIAGVFQELRRNEIKF